MIYNETRYNAHWNTKKLNELGEFARGKSKHRPRNDAKLFENGKYPLIQTGDVKAANFMITKHKQEYSEFGLQQSKLWDTGTLCITIAANIAETGILAYPMCFPDSVVGFNAYPTESSEEFMHYVFTFIRNSIQNSVNGSIQDNINIEYLTGLDFKVPDKVYQDKIVHALSLLDKKIELNNKVIAELEDMAKTIYDYWFAQFDFHNVEGKPYRLSGGEMVWNEQLKREIPKGWEINHLAEIEPNVITGKTPSTQYPENYNGDIPFITIGDIRNNVFVVSTEVTLSQVGADSQPTKYVPEDAICVTCIATPGLVGFATERSQTNQQINTVVCEDSHNKYYLYFAIKNHFKHSTGAKVGSTFANMNKDDFSSIEILKPDIVTIQQYHEIAEPFFEKIKKTTIEIKELSKFRDWLLPMLMNGQVTLK